MEMSQAVTTVPRVDARVDRDGNELPEWVVELRPHQEQAVSEVVAAYEAGAECVWLNGPTGAGKTLIAELVRREMGWGHTAYICSSLSLQDQFARDFPYARVLKGRSNYTPTKYEGGEYTCADCTKRVEWNAVKEKKERVCDYCWDVGKCPYEIAKYEAIRGGLCVVNTAYFLTENNRVGRLKRGEDGFDAVVVDECDTLEGSLMGFVEYSSVTSRVLKKLGLEAPKKGTHKATIVGWMDEELIPALAEMVEKTNVRQDGLFGDSDPKAIKEHTRWERLLGESAAARNEIEDENWVRAYDSGEFAFKPVTVKEYGNSNLWQHGQQWLNMSATIISPDELVESLGFEGEWAVVDVPMTFAVENRRIYAAPVANMVAKEKDSSYPAMAKAVARILDRHNGERVLVHTVSYELSKYLAGALLTFDTGREIVCYGAAWERDKAIRRFRESAGSCLIASSLERGIDLRDDDCRVIVVAKVPFPYLGDKQISERVHLAGGQQWYNVQTIRALVQMTGRAVRSEDDWCVTYILDEQFLRNIWRKSKWLLPKWWQDAVDMSFPTKQLRN